MNELRSGNWNTALELLHRGTVYAVTGIMTLLLVAVCGFASLIAIGGTGGFTSSPPPEHPAWFGLAIAIGLWISLQWGLIRLQHYLLRLIDRVSVGKPMSAFHPMQTFRPNVLYRPLADLGR